MVALPERECAREGCSVAFAPKTSRAQYHSESCRKLASYARKLDRERAGLPEPVASVAAVPDEAAEARRLAEEGYRTLGGSLVDVTRAQLERAAVADSPLGISVLRLAYRLEHGYHESGPALAALNREYRAALNSAVATAEEETDAVVEARMASQQTRFRLAAQRAG